jgi:hypothetical protein
MLAEWRKQSSAIMYVFFLVFSALHIYFVIRSLLFSGHWIPTQLCYFLSYEAMPFATAQPPTSIDQSWKYLHGMVCDPPIFTLIPISHKW